MDDPKPSDDTRLDKWLWAARFYKTRSLAADEIDRGRVQVNGAAVKASRSLKVGDTVLLRQGIERRTVIVRGLSKLRGPAPVAQALYEETAESIAARSQAAEQRRLAQEPALAIAQARQGRPTKRDRRELQDARDRLATEPPPWKRWSAGLDDAPED